MIIPVTLPPPEAKANDVDVWSVSVAQLMLYEVGELVVAE
jgi:hypothetical protein